MNGQHLVSVNVGRPREVVHEGRHIRTGIFKDPVPGPVRVGRLNLDGDEQADLVNHGGADKAVYAFALEQYAYWREALGRASMPCGQFGENLTIAGLDESAACVGDRLRIGSARFVVTQPRVPCFKLGLRMQHPDMPKLFSAHAWTGFYLRVETEGVLEAGDAVELVHRATDSVSIRDLFRAFTHPGDRHAGDVLARALELPDLAADWREPIRRRLRATRHPAS